MSGPGMSILRNGVLLAVIAVAGVSLLAGVHLATRDRIAEQEKNVILRQLGQVLPMNLYDNDLLTDVIRVHAPDAFLHPAAVTVYRARQGGDPAALVMLVTAPDGYNGDIRMVIAILADGTLGGVRVISHRETPGLGDPIEAERSDWIFGFTGRSLENPGTRGWAVRKDGGDFDQFTGATITPRAVVAAVHRTLVYHERHRDELFNRSSEAPEMEP